MILVSDYDKGSKIKIPDLPPIKDRTFSGLKRLENGHFSDSDLANILYNVTEESAEFFPRSRLAGSYEIFRRLGHGAR